MEYNPPRSLFEYAQNSHQAGFFNGHLKAKFTISESLQSNIWTNCQEGTLSLNCTAIAAPEQNFGLCC